MNGTTGMEGFPMEVDCGHLRSDGAEGVFHGIVAFLFLGFEI